MSSTAAAADFSAPDESDFVASAAVGNAQRTESAKELMTPTLGDAFVEEDDDAVHENENEKKKLAEEEEEKERRVAEADAENAGVNGELVLLSCRVRTLLYIHYL